jgi:hypothetical protein
VTVTTDGAQLAAVCTRRFLGRARATRVRGAALALALADFTTAGRGLSA